MPRSSVAPAWIPALAAIACLFTPHAARGDGFPEVLFILDASGSMSEDAGNERKIDAAKRVMAKVVPGLEPEVRVGLVAYGHRTPGSCTDIETLVPAGSNDRDGLLQAVYGLEPRGKTPLSASILAGASMLKGRDVETSVVLVSDGLETCGGDPCEVVRQLRAAGVKLVVHTVGFNVDQNAAKQLACIAKGGGGQYFAANDGQALLEALQTVSHQVAKKVEQARVEFVGQTTGLGKLAISMPAGSEKSLKRLEITRIEDGKLMKTIDRVSSGSNHPLLSGQYQVVAYFGTPNYGDPTATDLGTVTVKKGETCRLQLGAIALNLPEELVEADWKNRVNIDEVGVYDAGTDNRVVQVLDNKNGYYNYLDKPVLPGVYDVKFQYRSGVRGPTTVAQRLVVKPGQKATATLDSGIRIKRGKGLRAWRLYRLTSQTADAAEDGARSGPIRELALESRWIPSGLSLGHGRFDHLFYPYLLPPGKFDLEVELEGMEEPLPAGQSITISQGQLLDFDVGL